MIDILLPTILLYAFGFFNLLGIKPHLLPQYIVFFIGSLSIYFVSRRATTNAFRFNARFLYLLFVLTLIVTFVIGLEVKGSKRWLDFYLFNFQPSEFFKIIFLMYMADYFTRYRRELDEPIVIGKALLYFALPTFIILKQPDLGTALVVSVTFITLLLCSGIPRRILFILTGYTAALLPLFWLTLHDYQKNRLFSFFNPSLDTSGIGYNKLQAIITSGSGKFLGKGLGFGTQSKLFFLPENHTDFAFSSLIEQFGFVGGFLIIVLFCILLVNIFKRVLQNMHEAGEEEYFRYLYTIGFFSLISFQLLLNMGMNLGIFPITGVPLPFISYGGSSLVSIMLGLALLP